MAVGSKAELIAAIEKEIKGYEEFLSRSAQASEIASEVQKKKEEAEARLQAVKAIPGDVLEEVGGEMLVRQQKEAERIDQALPVLPEMNVQYVTSRLNTSGSSSDSDVVARLVRVDATQTSWYPDFIRPLSALADSRSREGYLPAAYAKLNQDLRKRVSKAIKTARSALGGVATADLASQHLRGAVQKIWGELCGLARVSCKTVGQKRLELSNTAHRREVAECLGTARGNTDQIEELLGSLGTLYSDLSNAAKDPFQDHNEHLRELYTRWSLHLYNLAKALHI